MAASTNSGKVIVCGASAISLDHKPGEPTLLDRIVSAIKNIGKSNNASSAARGTSTARDSRHAQGTAA